MMNKDQTNQKHALYESMSMEELQELIRQDVRENTLDSESLDIILEILKEKNKTERQFEMPSIDESWARFQQRLEAVSVTPKKSSYHIKKWVRVAIATAAMFAVVFLAALPAAADGFNPINYIATWTENEIWLSPVRDFSEDSVKYNELPRLLRKYNITEPLLPTWLPERYAYAGCEVNDNFGGGVFLSVQFQHMDTENVVTLTILDSAREIDMYSPKDDKEVVEHSSNGIQHYIFSYNDSLSAMWVNDEIRCGLGGNVTMEELTKMIDSIYLTSETYWK